MTEQNSVLIGTPLKYDYEIDMQQKNRSHTKILELIEPDQKILEIGCAAGYMTRYLNEQKNCQVIGVEIDPNSAPLAKPYCDKLFIQDIETMDFDQAFSSGDFDVIIMADVIEHLHDAKSVLKRLRPLLKDTGYLLLSVPNGAHGSIALELLDGNWDYKNDGLLDNTHVHFFDHKNLSHLLEETGYFPAYWDRVIIHPRDTEMKTLWDNYPREVTAYLEKVNPEYNTYQFIVKAHPATPTGWKKGLEDAVAQTRKKADDLLDEIKDKNEQIRALTAQVQGFDNEFAKREKDYLQGLDQAVKKMEDEKEQVHSEYKQEIVRLENETQNVHKGYQQEIERQSKEFKIREEALLKQMADQQQQREDEIKTLQREIKHFQLEAASANQKYVNLDHAHQNTAKENSELKNAYIAQSAELDQIKNSLAWRLILRYRVFILWLLPHGSKRKQIYDRILFALIFLYRNGLIAFTRKVLSKLKPLKPNQDQALDPHDQNARPSKLAFPNFESIVVSIVIPVFNKSKYTYQCLCSLLEHTDADNPDAAYEVILIDNASTDDTAEMLSRIDGLNIIKNRENKGFVDACNQGAAQSRGKYVLLLNNDTQVTPFWLVNLLKTFKDKTVGAVGAKLIYPDGQLQEAGSIIWKDGTGWNYGKGDDPNKPQYSYVKEVDYCSGACLMIRKDLWDELGGFDTRYAPAYYEDTDLCFAIRQKGYKVVFQPEARIIHYEGKTSGTDINKGFKKYQQINSEKFNEKWKTVLAQHHFTGPDDLYLARERGNDKRILIVDHYVPTFDMDSGSLRMFSLIRIFTQLGFKVVFWPDNHAYHEYYTVELQRIGVEALYGDLDFETYLKTHGSYFDLILLSRPYVATNYIYAAKTFSKAKVIYDTVDLHFLRERRKAELDAHINETRWKDLEMFLAHQADETLVVSPIEKEILDKEGLENKVKVVSNIHSLETIGNTFEKRNGLMFIGGFMHLPNEDAMEWFVNSIFPKIVSQLPDIQLYIVGSHPTDKVKSFASDRVVVTGYVADVTPFFEQSRVFVSPLRYGAGVKGKIGQSLSYGLPVVTTHIGAEGMGLTHGKDVMIAEKEDVFAQYVVKVHQDKQLWENLSLNGRDLIENRFSPDYTRGEIAQIVRELCQASQPDR